MSRLRAVVCLSLAIFLVANGPVSVVALAAQSMSRAADSPRLAPRMCCCTGGVPCCCEPSGGCCSADPRDDDSAGALLQPSLQDRPAEPDSLPGPCCPYGSNCPCCAFCAAKPPCGLNVPRPHLDDAPCVGALPADLRLASPAGIPRELFHPPRA